MVIDKSVQMDYVNTIIVECGDSKVCDTGFPHYSRKIRSAILDRECQCEFADKKSAYIEGPLYIPCVT